MEMRGKDGHDQLISVLMPTYNVAPFVREAVDSILTQTYANFELIIVDDCSTDGTYEILKEAAASDQRIVLVRNETNSKICLTLNRAWNHARGEYIVRMDGDDLSRPERLERLKGYLDEHSDIDLVGSQVISIREDGEILSYKEYLRTNDYIRRGNQLGPCVSHIWMARRKVYERLQGYRNIPFAEDYDFLLRGEKAGFRYGNTEEYLYLVRIRKGNTGSTNGLQQRKSKDFVMEINRKKCESDDIEAQYRQAIQATEREQRKYERGHTHLEIAIESRKEPLKLIYHTMAGMAESKYIFRYMTESVRMRKLIMEENKKIPRKIYPPSPGSELRDEK